MCVRVTHVHGKFILIPPALASEGGPNRARVRESGMSKVAHGELWCDAALGLCVRCGSEFYPCDVRRLPKHCREFDAVCVRLDDRDRVACVLDHTPSETIRRPRGFPSTAGAYVGYVTAYDEATGEGTLDKKHAFVRDVVHAIGDGQVAKGELVEYRFEGTRVSAVTGHFGTAVSHVGRRLS